MARVPVINWQRSRTKQCAIFRRQSAADRRIAAGNARNIGAWRPSSSGSTGIRRRESLQYNRAGGMSAAAHCRIAGSGRRWKYRDGSSAAALPCRHNSDTSISRRTGRVANPGGAAGAYVRRIAYIQAWCFWTETAKTGCTSLSPSFRNLGVIPPLEIKS